MSSLFTASLNETGNVDDEELYVEGDLDNELVSHDDMPSLLTRRILRGHLVGDTRPYMVSFTIFDSRHQQQINGLRLLCLI